MQAVGWSPVADCYSSSLQSCSGFQSLNQFLGSSKNLAAKQKLSWLVCQFSQLSSLAFAPDSRCYENKEDESECFGPSLPMGLRLDRTFLVHISEASLQMELRIDGFEPNVWKKEWDSYLQRESEIRCLACCPTMSNQLFPDLSKVEAKLPVLPWIPLFFNAVQVPHSILHFALLRVGLANFAYFQQFSAGWALMAGLVLKPNGKIRLKSQLQSR